MNKFQKGDYVKHLSNPELSLGLVIETYCNDNDPVFVNFNSYTDYHIVDYYRVNELVLHHRPCENDYSIFKSKWREEETKAIKPNGELWMCRFWHGRNLVDPRCHSCDNGVLISEEEKETGLCEYCLHWDDDDYWED